MMSRWLAPKWFVPAAVGGVLFLLIAWDISARGLLFQLDQRTAEPLYDFGRSRETLHRGIVFVTDLGIGVVITSVGVLNVLLLLWRREWQAAAVFTLGQWLVQFIIPFVKGIYTRVRPPFLGWTDYSFPSGHAFGSAVVYGCSVFVVWHIIDRHRFRLPTVAMLALLIAGIALSRPLYGAHYLSDVLAGAILGLSYVCVLIGFGNPRKLKRQPKAAGNNDQPASQER